MAARKAKEIAMEANEPQTAEKSDNLTLLQGDIIDLARDICKGIKDGSCRDYYKSIEAVINLYDAAVKK